MYINITLKTEMKRFVQKWKQLNNKSNECNIRFHDTYRLYKYNIGIDYHQIKKINKKSHTKSQIIKAVIVILDLMTLTTYTGTI